MSFFRDFSSMTPSRSAPSKIDVAPLSVDSAVDVTTPKKASWPERSLYAGQDGESPPFSSPDTSTPPMREGGSLETGAGGSSDESRSSPFQRESRNVSFDGIPDIPSAVLEDDEDSLFASDNYYSKPEYFCDGSAEELETLIDDYKGKIQAIVSISTSDSSSSSRRRHSDASVAAAKALWSEKKQDLVSKLVQLRIRQQDLKENPNLEDLEHRKILGHKFRRRDPSTATLASLIEKGEEPIAKLYCEQCLAIIWRLLQSWQRCVCCGYACHTSCLNRVVRTCVASRLRPATDTAAITTSSSLFAQLASIVLTDIAPEKGLANQNYKCHECKHPINFGSSASEEPRLCDYSGLYFCYRCHWNDEMVTPARILHNWDFEPRLVSRSSRQFIRLVFDRPFIRVNDINPMLFSFVTELDRVKTMREEILIMKRYFTTCKKALESKLLLRLRHRQHFVENSDMFSLQDLVDVHEKGLEEEIAEIHAAYTRHICKECELCRAKGFLCEHCQSEEVIFPFGVDVTVCPRCANVFHRLCFRRNEGECRRCDRIEERKRRRSTTDPVVVE